LTTERCGATSGRASRGRHLSRGQIRARGALALYHSLSASPRAEAETPAAFACGSTGGCCRCSD
jgi:hypothetical protein